jgi:hypothetical protein
MNSLTKVLVFLFCSGTLFIIVANGVEDTHGVEAPRYTEEAYVEPLKTKYTEEAYTLEDGTLCTIIRGSLYNKISSITCNYNQHRNRGNL